MRDVVNCFFLVDMPLPLLTTLQQGKADPEHNIWVSLAASPCRQVPFFPGPTHVSRCMQSLNATSSGAH